MAAAAWLVHRLLWHDAGTLFQHATTLAVAILVGGVVFLAVGTALRVRELAMLLAMGADAATARGSLRISFGHSSRDDDVDAVLRVLPGAVERARRAALAAAGA